MTMPRKCPNNYTDALRGGIKVPFRQIFTCLYRLHYRLHYMCTNKCKQTQI